MSMVFRLELTERELDDLRTAIGLSETEWWGEQRQRMEALADRLRALEPVGTEGGS